MPRITLLVDDREHKALRLLALKRDETMVALIKKALTENLEVEGAFDLCIGSSSEGSSEGRAD